MKILKLLFIALAGLTAWGLLVGYLALNGAWMTPVAASGDAAAFYEWAVGEMESSNKGSSALVLLQDGEVVKEHFSGPQASVDEHTLFPMASFSKWIAALGVMSLAADGRIDLDAPVSEYLERWNLPASEFDNDKVTARRLLSHTAGLTDGLGFGEYGAEEVLPTIDEELRNPRASSGESVSVAVGVEPGSEFIYSGGGYLVLELLVEEVTGMTFEQYIQETILDPLGMQRSTYVGLAGLENVSLLHEIDGTVGPFYQYASAAATGLSSTSHDLTRLARAMLSPANGLPLQRASIESMREPYGFVMGAGIWGLGTMLYAPSPNGDYVFGHDGANDPAINTAVRLNPDNSDGIIALVSGHPSLASSIGSEWVLWQTGMPDLLQVERAINSGIVPFLIGSLVLLLALFAWSLRWRSAGSRG